MNTEQRPGYPLVKQQGQYGDHGTFYQIQGRDTQDNEGCDIVDGSVDGAAHADDGIQRNAVKLGELGQQIDGVEGAAENCENYSTEDQSHQSAFAGLLGVIDDDSGQNQAAAHGKVGKVTDKGGGSALQQQLQQQVQP